MTFSRRMFVGGLGTAVASLGVAALPSGSLEAQLIAQRSDWNDAAFEKLVRLPARAKQVYDIRGIDDGKFLNNVKNSLNGLHFGFGIPDDQIKVVVAMHGPSNMLNFDDAMWQKYRLGEFVDVNDPATGKPATRNIFYSAKSNASDGLQDESSKWQDRSLQALQRRGVQFLSCHTASEEQAHAMVKKFSLQVSPDDIVKDLQAHTLPGVLVVPSMVATIALLQSEGHYTYITV